MPLSNVFPQRREMGEVPEVIVANRHQVSDNPAEGNEYHVTRLVDGIEHMRLQHEEESTHENIQLQLINVLRPCVRIVRERSVNAQTPKTAEVSGARCSE